MKEYIIATACIPLNAGRPSYIPCLLSRAAFIDPLVLRSQEVAEEVSIVCTINRLCYSVLWRMQLPLREGLECVGHIDQGTSFPGWRNEGPSVGVGKKSMYTPILVKQKGQGSAVRVQVFADVRQPSQGWMQDKFQSSVAWVIRTVVQHGIPRETFEQRQACLITASNEAADLGPIMLEQLRNFRNGSAV